MRETINQLEPSFAPPSPKASDGRSKASEGKGNKV